MHLYYLILRLLIDKLILGAFATLFLTIETNNPFNNDLFYSCWQFSNNNRVIGPHKITPVKPNATLYKLIYVFELRIVSLHAFGYIIHNMFELLKID